MGAIAIIFAMVLVFGIGFVMGYMIGAGDAPYQDYNDDNFPDEAA